MCCACIYHQTSQLSFILEVAIVRIGAADAIQFSSAWQGEAGERSHLHFKIGSILLLLHITKEIYVPKL